MTQNSYPTNVLSAFIFFTLFTVYCFIIVYIDNTNITTTNGLYKSVSAQGWADWKKFNIESGGALYFPFMGLLCKLIPDAWVSFYGQTTEFVAYRKLAFINGLFGAAASTIVYLLAFKITRNQLWSLGSAIFHAFAGYVLVNSIISEDILPGYFFFLFSAYCFYSGMVEENKRLYFTLVTCSVLSMLLLHWTLFPPVVVGYGIATLFLIKEDRKYLQLFLEQLILFLLLAFLFVKLANIASSQVMPGAQHLSLRNLLLPGKAGATSSWKGWNFEKVYMLFSGIGNYLLGGEHVVLNTGNTFALNQIFTPLWLHIILSWVATVFAFGIIIVTHYTSNNKKLSIFSILILGVFITAQIENLYATPAEPQFQIQPMFLVPYVLILLCLLMLSAKKLAFIPLIAALTLGSYNVNYLASKYKGGDSKMVQGYKEFRQQFPRDKVKLFCVGLEGSFITWLWLFDYDGSWEKMTADVVIMNYFLHAKPNISGAELAKIVTDGIEQALERQQLVLATSPWVNPESIYVLKVQNLPSDQIKILSDILSNTYEVKKVHHTGLGDFAELKKKNS